MAKKGGSHHMVRMRANKRVGVIGRKKIKWLLAPSPGPHKKSESVSAGVLLRDVLGRCTTMREAKRIFGAGGMTSDGKKIRDSSFPIGLMDIVSEPALGKHYRMSLDGPNLSPKEISKEQSQRKYLKVAIKRTIAGKKIQITFHDGRTFIGDNHIKTGDTCVFSVPEFKMLSHLKLEPGASCLVTDGYHRGEVAKLDKIIQRPGSHDTEVQLSGSGGQFITVAKYLFVVDANY